MRIWLDPGKMALLGVTTDDVSTILNEQNVVAPAGTLGENLRRRGADAVRRLGEGAADHAGGIRCDRGAHRQRRRDRAAQGHCAHRARRHRLSRSSRLDGVPTAIIGVYQLPDANALDVARGVRGVMDQLAPTFPQGIHYSIPFHTTLFVAESVHEVVEDTAGSGPAGAAGGVHLPGELARNADSDAGGTGVAGRRIQRVPRARLLAQYPDACSLWCWPSAWWWTTPSSWSRPSPQSWTVASCHRRGDQDGDAEVSGPVLAIALVLISVFVPVSFLGGLTGQFYRQFALTLAVSVASHASSR